MRSRRPAAGVVCVPDRRRPIPGAGKPAAVSRRIPFEGDPIGATDGLVADGGLSVVAFRSAKGWSRGGIPLRVLTLCGTCLSLRERRPRSAQMVGLFAPRGPTFTARGGSPGVPGGEHPTPRRGRRGEGGTSAPSGRKAWDADTQGFRPDALNIFGGSGQVDTSKKSPKKSSVRHRIVSVSSDVTEGFSKDRKLEFSSQSIVL